jgi:hypothetical protein
MSDTKRTTGNDPADGADPGGTHSTKPSPATATPSEKPKVQSGDQNDNPKRP